MYPVVGVKSPRAMIRSLRSFHCWVWFPWTVCTLCGFVILRFLWSRDGSRIMYSEVIWLAGLLLGYLVILCIGCTLFPLGRVIRHIYTSRCYTQVIHQLYIAEQFDNTKVRVCILAFYHNIILFYARGPYLCLVPTDSYIQVDSRFGRQAKCG